MHAELIFKIPEEAMEFQMASWGHKYLGALQEIQEILRQQRKMGYTAATTVECIEGVLIDINPLLEQL